jgi:hypothetical protein
VICAVTSNEEKEIGDSCDTNREKRRASRVLVGLSEGSIPVEVIGVR